MKRLLLVIWLFVLGSIILFAQSPRNVTVTTPGGTATLSRAFNVIQPAPTITSFVHPDGTPVIGGNQGTSFPAEIRGTFLNGATSVTLDHPGVTIVIRPGGTATVLPVTVVVDANAPLGP